MNKYLCLISALFVTSSVAQWNATNLNATAPVWNSTNLNSTRWNATNLNSTGPPVNITLDFNATGGTPVLFRDDWYKYYYNYYAGDFYSYYEDRYMTKVNATLDEIQGASDSQAAFEKYCNTSTYSWNATSQTYYYDPNSTTNSTSTPSYNYEQYIGNDPTVTYYAGSYSGSFYDPSTIATGSYANYYYNNSGNVSYDYMSNGTNYYYAYNG